MPDGVERWVCTFSGGIAPGKFGRACICRVGGKASARLPIERLVAESPELANCFVRCLQIGQGAICERGWPAEVGDGEEWRGRGRRQERVWVCARTAWGGVCWLGDNARLQWWAI